MPGGIIGALRVVLSADTGAFSTGMAKARAEASGTAASIQKSLSGLKNIGLLGGFTAGALVAGFVAASKSAVNYAASLKEVAQQTGTTVEQYQILARAALTNGAEQGLLDNAMKKLNKTLGEAQGGAKQAIQAFKNLGISKEQLDGFQRAGDAFPFVAEGVKNLKTESLQAAGAAGVMGKASGALLPILTQGKAGYDSMATAAKAAGLITQAQAEKADAAKDSIDLLAYSLKTNLASALVDVLPDIEALVRDLSQLVSFIVGAMNKLAIFRERINQAQGFAGSYTQGTPKGRQNAAYGQATAEENIARLEMEQHTGTTLDSMLARWRGKPAAGATGANSIDLAGPGPKGRSAASLAAEAARKREKALRDQAQVDDQIRRSKMDELQAQQNLATDYVDRDNIAIQLIDLDKEQKDAQIDLGVKLGDMTAATGDQLKAANERLALLQKQKVIQEEELNRQRDFAQLQDADFSIRKDRLSAESQLADTADERRKVELEILDLTYEEKRAQIERLKNSQNWADQEEGRRQEAALPGQYQVDRAGVLKGTMNPLQSFLNDLPTSAAKANEALEKIAAEGLQSLTDGLTDAIMGAKSLGDVFKNVARQIIADLIRIQIQKTITGPLASALGGLFGGGFSAGGIDASLPNVVGMASGGAFTVAGRGGTDRNLLSLNGLPVARVSLGERVSVSNDNGPSRGNYFDLRGAVMTEDLLQQMNMMAEGAAVRGAVGGAGLAHQQSARAARRRLA